MRVALLSCTKSKRTYPCQASEMYMESANFSHAYQYAKLTCDMIFILSSKYGLLGETDFIEPYEETLNDKTVQEREVWSKAILQGLSKYCSFEEDEFLVLTGRTYNEFLLPHIKNYQLPLKGLSIGYWIPELKRLIAIARSSDQVIKLPEIRQEAKPTYDAGTFLHTLFNNMPRWTWSEINQVPFNNGIYIIFEDGQKYLEMDRIVRVGTHTSPGNLKNRLKNHYIMANKDGSIFRKNIGLALLHKRSDSYEYIWAKDTSIPTVKESLGQALNWQYKMEIENEVTSYLRENTSFTCFLVDSATERLRLEEGIIALLNHSSGPSGSTNWLGKHSPKPLISNSGLWNVQGLDGKQLSANDLNSLKKLVQGTPEKIHPTEKITPNTSGFEGVMTTAQKPEPKQNDTSAETSLSNQIQQFIHGILTQCREMGIKGVILVSGDIHKKMGLQNRMPSVCQAMRKVMLQNDEVLYKTPSGDSSTLRILYKIE